MSCAIRLHRQARQQQPQNDTENQLFLLRQPIHTINIAENNANGNNAIYDLRLTIYAADSCASAIRNSYIINIYGSDWAISEGQRDILRQSRGWRIVPSARRCLWVAIV